MSKLPHAARVAEIFFVFFIYIYIYGGVEREVEVEVEVTGLVIGVSPEPSDFFFHENAPAESLLSGLRDLPTNA